MNEQKKFVRGNLIFLFVAAFLVGVIAKKAIGDHMYIGFEDPQVHMSVGTLIDMDEVEQEVIRRGLPEEVEDTSQDDEIIEAS